MEEGTKVGQGKLTTSPSFSIGECEALQCALLLATGAVTMNMGSGHAGTLLRFVAPQTLAVHDNGTRRPRSEECGRNGSPDWAGGVSLLNCDYMW